MTRTRYKVINEAPHFLTCAIVGWLPVFSDPAAAEIIINSFRYMQDQNRMALCGYVIMENHLHLIATSQNLSNELRNFKAFTAKKMIGYLERKGRSYILEQSTLVKEDHKTDRDYQVWQEGFHPQLIADEEMFRQKLEYMHYNPVRRGYVDDPVHWRYSSARNYAGMQGIIEAKNLWI